LIGFLLLLAGNAARSRALLRSMRTQNPHYVRYWHKADKLNALTNVSYRR